ncbi:hypothetical protein ANCCAN_22734 [Ancylostoma caninum]|uniref:Uncharacterized protein n=1 Tax=Ancylostoma caninum TaxID=29170 RepID=A0A368FGV8_ANCCA|nr:hypothetical protein ANCCAN_22734 [Ancylostoma caninum]
MKLSDFQHHVWTTVQFVIHMLSAYLVKEGTTFVTVTTGTRAMEGRAFVSAHCIVADFQSKDDTLLVSRGMAIFQRGVNPETPGKQVP